MSLQKDIQDLARARARYERVLQRNLMHWRDGPIEEASRFVDTKEDVTLAFAAYRLIRACALGAEAEATLGAIRGSGSPLEELVRILSSQFSLAPTWPELAPRIGELATHYLGGPEDEAQNATDFDIVLDMLGEHHERLAIRQWARQEGLPGFEVPDKPSIGLPDEPGLPEDVAFHVTHYLKRQRLVPKVRRKVFDEDPYRELARYGRQPRPTMLNAAAILPELPLPMEERTNLEQVLLNVDEAIRNLGYHEFFEELLQGVHDNSVLIDSGRSINLIPSNGMGGGCCPVLLAFARGDRRGPTSRGGRRHSLHDTCATIREHLITCHAVTKVVALVTDVWNERELSESLPDFRAHAARGVRFVAFIAHAGGLSPVSLPL